MVLFKFIKGVPIAMKGILHAISREQNLRIQILVGLFIIIISILLKIPKIEFIIILAVSFLVIILELINTTFEKLIDRLSPNYDKEYGKIKDTIGGVALLGVILSIVVGILILYKPIISFITSLVS